ncbi:MAG: MazG nucleotide pyrophosphohydrolase domain-containing protein [Candidatus Nanohaloarchaea archaeon]
MKQSQRKVEEFIERNDLEGTTAFRIIDLFAEVGEIASDAAKSADYGDIEDELEVSKDEIGDALFSLLAVASDLGIDAEEALEESIEKYGRRIQDSGDPGSG